jgi:hypothetical protein
MQSAEHAAHAVDRGTDLAGLDPADVRLRDARDLGNFVLCQTQSIAYESEAHTGINLFRQEADEGSSLGLD